MRLNRTTPLPLLALAVVACGSGGFCKRVSDLPFEKISARPYADGPIDGHAPLAVLGDTQRTSVQECLIGREVNDAAQRALLRDLIRRRPGALVHAGDMVFDGSALAHWQYFDWLMRGFRRLRVPILPVLGNHEYWGLDTDALAHLRARFPSLAPDAWSVVRWGAVAVVRLDSNEDALGAAAWERQRGWFVQTLATLDADPSVRGVLVVQHHPPYTNSPIIDGHEGVRRDLLEPFCRSRKTLTMLSGHAHGYERFERGPQEGCGDRARQLVITGGGGGPRPGSLRPASETGLRDRFAGAAPRPLNFLILRQTEAGVSLRARGLSPGDSHTHVMEELELRFPPSASLLLRRGAEEIEAPGRRRAARSERAGRPTGSAADRRAPSTADRARGRAQRRPRPAAGRGPR